MAKHLKVRSRLDSETVAYLRIGAYMSVVGEDGCRNVNNLL